MINHRADGYIHLGILGGGQLCRMMLPYCHRYNLKVYILDKEDAPSAHLAHEFLAGCPKDAKAVLELGKKVDIITMDREDVNTLALKELREQGKLIHPLPEIIELIQDKGLQKQFLQKEGIPTAGFHFIESKEDILRLKMPFPLIQKKRRGGYDGQGVFMISNESALKNAFEGSCIVEEMVDIDRELSCIIARNERGDIQFFPMVEMIFDGEKNILDYLICPASLYLKDKKIIEEICSHIAHSLNLCGVLAVEFFMRKDGKLLVNELAPRPHNSGHHTIEACSVSQFEQHLRGVLGLPLTTPLLHGSAITWNIIGTESGIPLYKGWEKLTAIPQTYLHLYGKEK